MLGIAFFRLPLESKPGQIAQLQGPGDGVSGNQKLVIENGSLIHIFLVFVFPQARVRASSASCAAYNWCLRST